MIRFDLKLLEDEGNNPADSEAISKSNAVAQHACNHLKKLIGKKKCRKHPSSPNKIRMFAILGGDPKAELVSYCCPAFVKLIR
ncbi:hypothetical protein [Aurantibacillus circumpalustris]|uniref:hypothetical protein n=1 Tax=Aurantibacillus circumpalustris TaxID=3036359 RepID=UPI00295BA16D|nr:hypothetical protein [Aurantibacillus circumpalustris]